MMDKELLRLAAKAAGITFYWSKDGQKLFRRDGGIQKPWNPLEHDGDAFQLMIKLGIQIMNRGAYKNHDPYAATRRAIVRAAAKIGGIRMNKWSKGY